MSVDLTEEVVKKQIRSLLNSNPRISTMRNVEDDYESFIGFPIPSKKFGYNSTEHFLKSIPDVCTVKGTGPYAEVLLVLNEKIAYNTKMVLEQNVNTPKSAARKRLPCRRRWNELRSLNQTNYNANRSLGGSNSNYYNNTNQEMNYPSRVPPPLLSLPIHPTFLNINQRLNEQPLQPHFTRLCHSNLLPAGSTLKSPQTTHFNVNRSQENPLVQPTHPTQPNVDRLKGYNVQPLKPNVNRYQESQPVSTSVRPTSSPVTVGPKTLALDHIKLTTLRELVKEEEKEEKDNSNVPKKVQENLTKLIAKFENGLWCSELRTRYFQMFKRELFFVEYGYGSLIDMCIALKHIFHYVRPGNDDFKLYDRSKPLPSTAEKSFTIASYDSQLNKSVLVDQALPELNWSDLKGLIPDDVFEFGENIPRQFLPQSTKAEDSVRVIVMEIYDLSKFWFYLGEEEKKLDILMEDLQVFFNNSDNAKQYSIIPAAVQVGLYCVQIIFGEYHRAKILKILPNDQVRLLYIDFGTVGTASIEGMCFLPQKFSKLPAQAIRGRLANIIPLEKGHAWPPSAVLRFKELMNHNISTQMKISYVDWTEQYVCGFIADVSNVDNVKYVNEILVKEGHALWENQTQKPSVVMSKSTCIVQNPHLFPTFQELELSLAPNFDETYFYSQIKVPVQFCLPNYFKVDNESDDSYSEMYEGLMETAKKQQRFPPLYALQDEVEQIDFNLFGNFKQDLINYLVKTGEKPPEIEEELQHESDKENLSFYNSAREKCEDLISRLNLSSSETHKNINYEHLSEDDDDLSIVMKHSESSQSESRSPPFCHWGGNNPTTSDLNIFDNPEAFENSANIPTANEFFQNLENKISKSLAFLAETEKLDEHRLQNSSNLDIIGTDLQANVADKVVTSNLDPTSKEFVSTLGLNNPFRQFLSLSECETVETTTAEPFVTMVDNKTDSDSTSSEYYGTSPVNLNVDTMSNASRTRQFVENLPSNVSSPKSASFQTDTPNPVFSDSSFASTPKGIIPQPTQFSTPNENTQSFNWPGYSQWNGALFPYPVQNPHRPPMPPVRHPPGFHPQYYQTQFRPFANQVVGPPAGLQNQCYPQYGYFPPGPTFANLQTPDFYDRYNEQILRQRARNN